MIAYYCALCAITQYFQEMTSIMTPTNKHK